MAKSMFVEVTVTSDLQISSSYSPGGRLSQMWKIILQAVPVRKHDLQPQLSLAHSGGIRFLCRLLVLLMAFYSTTFREE